MRRFSISISMKLVHTFGNLMPAINLLIVAFGRNLSPPVVVVLFSVTFIFVPFFSVSILRGATVLQPNYAKFMSGLTATAGYLGFITSPYLVELITAGRSHSEWVVLLCILSTMFLLSWVVYLPIRFGVRGPEKK